MAPGFSRRQVAVFTRLEQRLGSERGQRRLVGALQHRHRLLAGQRRHHFGFRERLQELDRNQPDLFALAAQMGDDGLDVVAYGTETDHHRLGVVAQKAMHRLVLAAGQYGILGHRLAHQRRHGAREVRAVVGRTGLEVGLVLHRPGHAGIVDIHQRRNELARALLESVFPLTAPRAPQFLGQPGERLVHPRPRVVLLDLCRVGVEVFLQQREPGFGDVGGMAREEAVQLEHAALGTEQDFLRERRRLDAPGRVPQIFAQKLRFRQERLAHHVAGGEAVHRIGHRNQRQGRRAVGNRREIGRFLRIGAEQDGVTRRQQGIDVVVPGHHVERMLGNDARRHLQHEAADLLADCHVMRFERVEDALARRSVGNELPAGQRRAQRAALRRMFALGLEEEGVLAPHVDAAFRPEGFIKLGDFGGRGDRVADHAAAHVAHDVGDGAVAVDDGSQARIFRFIGFFHGHTSKWRLENSTARAIRP